MFSKIHSKGQVLVELLVALGLASLLIPALLTGFISSREGRLGQEQRMVAIGLMKEAEEALRSVRGSDWNNIAQNGTFHPEITETSWLLVSGEEIIDEFTRYILISDYQRNGKVDPSVKRIDIRVSWNVGIERSVNNSFLLTRYMYDDSFIQTTEEDFLSGTQNFTVVTNSDGGEVQLGGGGTSSWCRPNLTIVPVDLPKQGVANAISAIEGRVFAGTGDNASGVSFANVTISNDKPPVANIEGTIDGYKTNGIFGEDDYVYLATDNNFKEVVVIDLRNLPYSEIGYFNAPGNGTANSVYVSGNTGYMISANMFYTFDLSDKSGLRPLVDSDGVALAGVGKRVMVVGNYAYLVIDSSSVQLQIVDISNPANLTVVGQASVSGLSGRDVYVNQSGTRAYLVTEVSSTQNEFFIINLDEKSGDRSTMGSFDTSGTNPKGVTVVPGNRAIVVGTGGEEYQVYNITDETKPVYCGGLNVDTGINGLSSVLESDGDAYSYIITGDASSELKIIEGGPGGSFSTEGVFESRIFDMGKETAFNRFTANFFEPPGTDVRFQFAAADPVNGVCEGAHYAFAGPDATSGTYYSQLSSIAMDDDAEGYENPAQCFKYRVYFSTWEISITPVFTDITVNYSP